MSGQQLFLIKYGRLTLSCQHTKTIVDMNPSLARFNEQSTQCRHTMACQHLTLLTCIQAALIVTGLIVSCLLGPHFCNSVSLIFKVSLECKSHITCYPFCLFLAMSTVTIWKCECPSSSTTWNKKKYVAFSDFISSGPCQS